MNDFELEQEKTRQQVAAYLRQLAEGLESNDKVTLISGEQSVTINPPQTVHFRINADSDSSWLGSEDGRSVNIEMGWEGTDIDTNDDLTIVQQPSRETPGAGVGDQSTRTQSTQGDSVVDDDQRSSR